jgi:hypothetical protein
MPLKSRFGGKAKKRTIILPSRKTKQGQSKRPDVPVARLLPVEETGTDAFEAHDVDLYRDPLPEERGPPQAQMASYDPFNSRNNYNYARRMQLRVEKWIALSGDLRRGFKEFHLLKQEVDCQCSSTVVKQVRIIRIDGKLCSLSKLLILLTTRKCIGMFTYDMRQCNCGQKLNLCLFSDIFPTYTQDCYIDIMVLRLYRSLNLRGSLTAQALVDSLKGGIIRCIFIAKC